MKLFEKHIATLLLSIALSVGFGNVSVALPNLGQKNQIAAFSEVQKKDQNKSLVFHERSVGEASQTVSQNEYFGLGLLGMCYSGQDFSFARVASGFNASYFLKDHRELIFRYLFPFHFFW
ncbi:hypothetical protein F3C99_01175 [Vitellibacter sp. q18]|nr:hypothetical protein [Aequorivita lutea]